MSTGIVSSKEGHDESHIDDTKLGTKFNDVNIFRERENLSLRHSDLKVLNLFLRLIHG